MSIRWWRSQVFILYFATRLSGSHMSSTSLPGNRKASDICDSPEAPNLKKVKLDECTSSEKPQKNMPSTASLFPVRSKLSDSCQQHAKLAAQQDVPSSAFKVSSGSSFNTESSDIISQEGQSDQTLKEDSPMESEAQETQNKAQDGEIKAQDSIENVMVASSPDCLKMEGREEGANDETVVCVTTGTVATDIDAQDMCSSDNDIEAMDSQEEGESQETQTEDSSSCEVWEQLPFFASEMDQLDETDGGNVGPKRVKKEAANKKKHGEKGGKKMVEKVTKPKKPPPNAFVAVRIPSPIISAKFEEVQRALQEKDERLKQVFVPAAKNHITLMVTRLNNPEEIVQAKLALFEATERAKSELDLPKTPLELNFSGLGNFSRNVLFAKVAEGPSRERLITMAGLVESVFASKELSSSSTSNFIPHLTIAKMSKKPSGRRHHKKKKGKGGNSDNELHGIDHSAYAELLDTEFGRQNIEGLELLSMIHPPTEDGYYHCYQRYLFTSS